jgi:hypothetical protein
MVLTRHPRAAAASLVAVVLLTLAAYADERSVRSSRRGTVAQGEEGTVAVGRRGAVAVGDDGAAAVGRHGAVAVGEEGAASVGRYGGVVVGERYESTRPGEPPRAWQRALPSGRC